MSVKLDANICRVCLCSSGRIPIFDGLGKDDQFRFCTSLEATEEDSLPKNLCAKCNDHLKIAYDFRFQAIYAEKYLRKTIFLPSLKNELESCALDTIDENSNNELDENMTEIDKLLSLQGDIEVNDKDPSSVHEYYSDNHNDDDGNDSDSADAGDGKLAAKPLNIFKLEIEQRAVSQFGVAYSGNSVDSAETNSNHRLPQVEPSVSENASDVGQIQYQTESQFSDQADNSHSHMNLTQLQPVIKQLPETSTYPYNPAHYSYPIHDLPTGQYATNAPNFDYQYNQPQYDQYIHPEPVSVAVPHINPEQNLQLPPPTSYEPPAEATATSIAAIPITKPDLAAEVQQILNTVKPQKAPTRSGKTKRDKIECNLCGTVFTHINSLRNHMLIHSGQKPFKCEYCGKAFARKTVLNIHRRLHTGERPYKCRICDDGFVTKEAMLRHMGKDHEAETNMKKVKVAFICSICNKSRCSKYSLAAHMKTHTRDGKKRASKGRDSSSSKKDSSGKSKYACATCDEQFDNKWDLSKHAENHEKNKSFSCDVCSRVFEKKYQLLYHLQTHEGGDELVKAKMRPPAKQDCEEQREEEKSDESESKPEKRKVSRRENLKRLKYSNSKVECQICEAVFTHPCSLKSHMLVHSGERPHKCDICDKSFARKNVLNIHRRLHTGEKPYKCPMCSTTAVTKDALMRHMSKDHDDDKEQDKLKYTCGICQKVMSSKYSLQSHMKLHEQKGTLNPDGKLKCTICGESFDTKCDYNNHVAVHETAPKTFQCDICQATFEKKFKLLFHLQTHTIEEISCKKCNQTFTIRENLIQHIKTHIDARNLDFQCPKCDIGVYDTRDLKLHMLEVHAISIGDINACDLCGLNYETAAEYYKHVNEKHDSINKTCHECDKYFESRKLFDKHMLTHYM